MRASYPVTTLRTREEVRATLENELEARIAEEMKANRIAATCEELVIATQYDRVIPCIKVIRLAFGLGLKEAKDAYDAARKRLDPTGW